MRNVYENLGGKQKEKSYFGKRVFWSSSAKSRNHRDFCRFLVASSLRSSYRSVYL